jgi:molybdopterin converting factor small subunit
MKIYFSLNASRWAVLLLVAVLYPFTTPTASANGVQDVEFKAGAAHLRLEVPISSSHFDETPVALVNEEPITMRELRNGLSALHAEMSDGTSPPVRDYRKIVERLINTRLIILEAKNIGLDETETMQAQIDGFAETLLIQNVVQNYVQDVEPDRAETDTLYRQMSREVRLTTLVFTSQEEAGRFIEQVNKGGDFDKLTAQLVEEGKVDHSADEEYVKLSELLQQVAGAVYNMEVGSISRLYQTGADFIVFRLDDIRFVEDEATKQQAQQIVLDQAKKKKARELSDGLFEKYVTLDEELFDSLDFESKTPADVKKMAQDNRPLAVLQDEPPITITVGDFVGELQSKYFHGMDKALKSKDINTRKVVVLDNMVFHETALIEARRLGLDRTAEYLQEIEQFENSALFSIFVDKVIVPEVRVSHEEVRSYYDEHLDDFSSPVMLRMNSLVFQQAADAENALSKLQKGADFKWVSANSVGLVDKEQEDVLEFDKTLLSVNTLPEGLQKLVRDPRRGDKVLYEEPDGLYYVLVLDEVYSARAEPYDQKRQEIAKIIFNNKIKEVLDDWTTQLKEAYEIQIFLPDTEQQDSGPDLSGGGK